MASHRSFPHDPYTAPYNSPYARYPVPPAEPRDLRADPGGSLRPPPRSPRPRQGRSGFQSTGPSTRSPSRSGEPAVKMAPKKPAPSAAEAALRLQAAARGFLARKSVRAVREVEREAEEARARIAREVEALCGDDARPRVAVGEALMRLLLRFDAVRGARDYRRRVTRRVLVLQDAVDAFEPKPEAGADEAGAAGAAEVPDVAEAEQSGEVEREAAADAPTDMEVDEAIPAGETEAAAAPGDANADVNKTEGSDAESEWEVVLAEERVAPEAASSHDAPRQEPAGPETTAAANARGDSDGVDARKVMEMVAALCERNAQQCAVIAALAERVDALERAVQRMEEAEPRRQRAKKLSKAGKGSGSSKFYSD